MYDIGPNTSKGFRVIRREREGNGEHESHATAALGLLFADSGGDGYTRELHRDLLDRTVETG